VGAPFLCPVAYDLRLVELGDASACTFIVPFGDDALMWKVRRRNSRCDGDGEFGGGGVQSCTHLPRKTASTSYTTLDALATKSTARRGYETLSMQKRSRRCKSQQSRSLSSTISTLSEISCPSAMSMLYTLLVRRRATGPLHYNQSVKERTKAKQTQNTGNKMSPAATNKATCVAWTHHVGQYNTYRPFCP
jgi:hypothetical protein